MTPKISIIVPVYNVEKYLSQCLQSLADQTLQDIEILVVNNNTPDRSQDIIDQFVARDKRFTALFRRDGMLGGARNKGLQHARGEYVLFVDSDDYVASTLCQKLWDIAQKENLDIVDACGADVSEDGRILFAQSAPPPQVYKTDLVGMMRVAQHCCKPWGKIIRRRILTDFDLWFPENRAHEDIAFITACFLFANGFAQIHERLYYYRHVPKSLSRTNFHLLPERLFANFIPVRDILKKHHIYTKIAPLFEYQLIHMIIGPENAGSGAIKYMSKEDIARFAKLENGFFDTLPNHLFKDRNFLFRFKFWVFRYALRHRYYSLPRLVRPLYKLLAIF